MKVYIQLIIVVVLWILNLVFGSLFYKFLLTSLHLNEDQVMPLFEKLLPTLLLIYTAFLSYKIGREIEKNQKPKTPREVLKQFMDRKIKEGEKFLKDMDPSKEAVINWTHRILSMIDLAFGQNTNDRDIIAWRNVIKDKSVALNLYKKSTDLQSWRDSIQICISSVSQLKKLVAHSELSSNYEPESLEDLE